MFDFDIVKLICDQSFDAVLDKSSSALPSTAKQAATASRIRRTSGVSTAFTTSGSEDEWEEVEDINVDEGMEEDPKNRTVEVTIEAPKKVESEESKWAKFIRQQVNRKIRERQINCHKVSKCSRPLLIFSIAFILRYRAVCFLLLI